MFKFFHEVDVKRVLEDGPRAYENNMLILKRLGPSETRQEVVLNMAEMWLQAHNLPNSYFMESVASAIGSTLGTFMHADKKNFEGSWKSFMRIRVQLDITKPVRRRLKMKKAGGEPFWVDFKYEQLANFCFLCGVIGHTEKFFHLLFEGANEETDRPFGSWLRAYGRRLTTNARAQWLISDDNQKEKTNSENAREEEKMGSNISTKDIHDVQSRQTTLVTSAQRIRMQESSVLAQSSGNSTKNNVYELLGQLKPNGPVLLDGLFESDQKRKRADNFKVMDLTQENMEEDIITEDVSKNLQEVGFARQAHLDQ